MPPPKNSKVTLAADKIKVNSIFNVLRYYLHVYSCDSSKNFYLSLLIQLKYDMSIF